MNEKLAQVAFDVETIILRRLKQNRIAGYATDTALEIARAAIEAMRGPTEAMVNAGNQHTDWADGADDAWDTMIDVALGLR